jgi:hypothetical protein
VAPVRKEKFKKIMFEDRIFDFLSGGLEASPWGWKYSSRPTKIYFSYRYRQCCGTGTGTGTVGTVTF